jgi:hypothetical protein
VDLGNPDYANPILPDLLNLMQDMTPEPHQFYYLVLIRSTQLTQCARYLQQIINTNVLTSINMKSNLKAEFIVRKAERSLKAFDQRYDAYSSSNTGASSRGKDRPVSATACRDC